MARTKMFTDKDGNKLIFRSLVQWGHDDDPSACDIILKAMTIGLATRMKMSDEWFEFDAEKFPHFVTDICSPAFEHGGATCLLFGGPEFNKMSAKLEAA